jgi:hypothetical protein
MIPENGSTVNLDETSWMNVPSILRTMSGKKNVREWLRHIITFFVSARGIQFHVAYCCRFPSRPTINVTAASESMGQTCSNSGSSATFYRDSLKIRV